MSSQPLSARPYIRPFDGVRALAVTLVLLMHWPLPRLALPFGWAGVNLFFVLSGLLITRILVAARGPDGPERATLRSYLAAFYARRTLRIFPLYYLYLGLTLALAVAWGDWSTSSELRHSTALLLTYLQNWREVLLAPPAPGPVAVGTAFYHRFYGHLWSLAVEEQYYLLFPLLVWLVPVRWLPRLLLLAVVAAPVGRAGLGEVLRLHTTSLGRAGAVLVAITPSHLDALALGGLLGLGRGARLQHPGRWLLLALVGALTWNLGHWLWLRALHAPELPPLTSLGFDHPLKQFRYAPTDGPAWLRMRWALTFSWVNGLSALLLLWAQAGSGRAQRLLANSPAVWVGRISYGIYVWHIALTAVPVWVAGRLGGSAPWEAGALLAYVAVVLSVSAASYYGFENFFLRLKARWEPKNGV